MRTAFVAGVIGAVIGLGAGPAWAYDDCKLTESQIRQVWQSITKSETTNIIAAHQGVNSAMAYATGMTKMEVENWELECRNARDLRAHVRKYGPKPLPPELQQLVR